MAFFSRLPRTLCQQYHHRPYVRYAPHATALLCLSSAAFQGRQVLQEYRNDDRGTLVVPRGKTQGVETHSNTLDGVGDMSMGQKLRDSIRRKKETITRKEQHLVEVQEAKVRAKHWLERALNRMREFSNNRGLLQRESASVHTASGVDQWNQIHQERSNEEAKCFKIIVIGDSLACGVGCVNTWEKRRKNTTTKLKRALTTAQHQSNDDGPVFPRFFAKALSKKLQSQPVLWKSAGVVGGDLDDIHRECMDVIRRECASSHPPDYIIVLCGLNDMKKILSEPFQSHSALNFRNKLTRLVREIRGCAPEAEVVLPALPLVPSVVKQSKFGAFPLCVILDRWIQFWDLQKRYVAEEASSDMVTFVERPGEDAFLDDDSNHDDKDRKESTRAMHHAESQPSGEMQEEKHPRTRNSDLSSIHSIAADGVHPNTVGYSIWARFIGEKVLVDDAKSE